MLPSSETRPITSRKFRTRLGDRDALPLHLLRQQRHRELQLVLHLHLRDVGIGAALEGERDRARVPFDVARRRDVAQVVEAVHLLLDDLGDRVLDASSPTRRGRSALMVIDGGAMLGYCAIGSVIDRDRAGQHDDDRDDPREDRPVDEEARHAVSGGCAPCLLSSGCGALARSLRCEGNWLTGMPGTDLLQIVGDHAVARLQTFGDEPLASHRAIGFQHAQLHLVRLRRRRKPWLRPWDSASPSIAAPAARLPSGLPRAARARTFRAAARHRDSGRSRGS